MIDESLSRNRFSESLASQAIPDSPVVTIVDDESEVAELIAASLQSLNVTIERYTSLQAFLKSMPAREGQYGCILLDVFLPDGNGLKVLEAKTHEFQRLGYPVIFISGYGNVRMAVNAMQKGSWTFLPKPLDLHQLRENVLQACEFSRQGLERRHKIQNFQKRWDLLTPPEVEVAMMIFAGIPSKVIANRLDIGQRTFELRRHMIFEKLQVETVSDFVKLVALLDPVIAAASSGETHDRTDSSHASPGGSHSSINIRAPWHKG